MGQLGFHINGDAIVTDVEKNSFAHEVGLLKGSRLVEICKVASINLSHEDMVDLLRTSQTVKVTLIPPLEDGTPRQAIFIPVLLVFFVWFFFGFDENFTKILIGFLFHLNTMHFDTFLYLLMKSYICLTNSKNMLRSLVCRPLKYALEICLQFNMTDEKDWEGDVVELVDVKI